MAARHLQFVGYVGVVAVCFSLGTWAGWTRLARRIDNQAYDLWAKPSTDKNTEAVIVAIDEATFREGGEVPNLRPIIATALEKIRAAHPVAVALDVTLGGASRNPADDDLLETAFRGTPNLVLNCLVDQGGRWEDPLDRFAATAAGIGHAGLNTDESDGVARQLPLDQIHAGESRWALALETYRVAHRAEIVGSTDAADLDVGSLHIPAVRGDDQRLMFVRFGIIPEISANEIDQHLDELRGKTVFLGVTALSAANDRLKIPTGETIAGVALHAQAYETIRRGRFLMPARNSTVFFICVALATICGAAFWFLSGWLPYGVVLPLLGLSLYLPRLFLAQDIVFPLSSPALVAWLCAAGAATYHYFVVRRTLRKAESEKARYQQAIHWAAHEMRTPLTAIQGSSELMTRYALPEEKRGQLNEMINSESKRLAGIIQTFLNMERLAEGHMELKRETFPAAEIVAVCLQRVTPLAERKQIRLTLDSPVEGTLTGDRELMEYAFYNLLTNAVKYSPAETHVRIRGARNGNELRLAVEDQGIGMDARELKSIFQKFYRTKRAEASGEVGTGIGLSIVEQIVTHHGGRIDVTSTPGKGSCFTMILVTH
jgi:signal transduction histidine kinase